MRPGICFSILPVPQLCIHSATASVQDSCPGLNWSLGAFIREYSVREHCYFFKAARIRPWTSVPPMAWFDSFWASHQTNLPKGTSLWIIEKAQRLWAKRHLRDSRTARRRPRNIIVQTARSTFRGAQMTKPSFFWGFGDAQSFIYILHLFFFSKI